MRKKFLAGLVIGVLMFVCSGLAAADTTLTSYISMDNGYIIYLSTSDTTAGTSFGSANDWYTTYQNSVTLTKGVDYYLHVYAYDQGGIAGFLGQFTLSGSDHSFSNSLTTLLTNAANWGANTTGWSDAYTTPLYIGTNGVGPWGTRANIDGSAVWIWSGDANNNDVVYFSTKISAAAVPVPAALPLLGSGLALLGFLRKRFTR